VTPARIALALAAFAVGILTFSHLTGDPPGAMGKLAREFSLPDTTGQAHASTEWAGRVRLINFWATWCPPCRREIPALIALQQDFGARGLQVIGIAMDDAEAVAAFARETGINYPLLVGDQDVVELAVDLGNHREALPYTVVLDRAGRIVHVHAGEVTEAGLAPVLERLL